MGNPLKYGPVIQSNGDAKIVFDDKQFSKDNELLQKILRNKMELNKNDNKERLDLILRSVGNNQDKINPGLLNVRAKPPTVYELYSAQIKDTFDTVAVCLGVNNQLSEDRKNKINKLKEFLDRNLNNNNIYFVQRITGMLLQLAQFQMSDTGMQGFDNMLNSVFTVLQGGISKERQDQYIKKCQIYANKQFKKQLKTQTQVLFTTEFQKLQQSPEDETGLQESYYKILDNEREFIKIQKEFEDGRGVIKKFYDINCNIPDSELISHYQKYLQHNQRMLRKTMNLDEFELRYTEMQKFVNGLVELYHIQIDNIAKSGPDQVSIFKKNLSILNDYKKFIEREHSSLQHNGQVRVLESNAPKLPNNNDYLDSIRQCTQFSTFISDLFNNNKDFFYQLDMTDSVVKGHQKIHSGVGKLKRWSDEQNQQLLPDMKQAQEVKNKAQIFLHSVIDNIINRCKMYITDPRLLEVLGKENDTIVPRRKPVSIISLLAEIQKEPGLPIDFQNFLRSDEFKQVLQHYDNMFGKNSVSYEQYCKNNPSKQEHTKQREVRFLDTYNQSQYQKPQPNYKQQQYQVGGDTIKAGRGGGRY